MKETIQRFDIGGRTVNEALISTLPFTFSTTYERELIRDLKHKKCGFKPLQNIDYLFPDNTLV